MITLLFIVILTTFIGLGLPDSLLGSAWPAIYQDFNVPISYANIISFLISTGTVLSSLFSARLINKFGTGVVTAASTILTSVCILGFSLSSSIVWLCLLAFPLGTGAGSIDAALNNYVAIHYSSTHMSLLHTFYGVGVSLSPFLMSLALGKDNNWRLGYVTVFYILAGISLITIISLPLWKKIKAKETPEQSFTPVSLSLKSLAKMPAVRTAWIMFFASVALEFTCGIWGSSYMVLSENLSESDGAAFLTLYYIGMTLGRFTSGLVSKKIHPQKTVYIGYSFVVVAILTLFLPVPAIIKGFALFFIGFGNGPTFPNLTYLTPINFGKEISQSVIGTQMACCNLGILIMPPVFGFLAGSVGTWLFPPFIAVLCAVMVIMTIVYDKQTQALRKKREES